MLRRFQDDPYLRPLGSTGTGLFAHLKELTHTRARGDASLFEEITARMVEIVDWLENIEIPGDAVVGEHGIRLRDKYLAPGALFDQRSANEGFLFLLFYVTLLVSDKTPAFFAIDNVEASLNPKLCTKVVREIVALAKKHDKQVILTTHSPAVLDGLDLTDDEQRLFVAERTRDGGTRVRRVMAPKPLDGDPPVALSDAFTKGLLGGLPKNF